MARNTPYDVITIDPAPPIHSAGTVNLYTREFLEICRSRITKGGVVCLWLPPGPDSEVLMIMRTFLEVFPGASLWGGFNTPGLYLIGGHRSYGQTEENLSRLARKLSRIEDLSEWESFYRDENTLKKLYLYGPENLESLLKGIPVVTDDHPYTEFPLWRGALNSEGPYLTATVFRQAMKRLEKQQ